jgi:hypothetical protein
VHRIQKRLKKMVKYAMCYCVYTNDTVSYMGLDEPLLSDIVCGAAWTGSSMRSQRSNPFVTSLSSCWAVSKLLCSVSYERLEEPLVSHRVSDTV